MTIFKTTCFVIATVSIFAMPAAAHAAPNTVGNGSMTSAINGTANGANVGNNIRPAIRNNDYMTLGGSSTASFFFRKAMKNFEAGNLEKSDYAFRAVLRADGSRTMDEVTLHYLAYINEKQGNSAEAKKYAEAYMTLVKK